MASNLTESRKWLHSLLRALIGGLRGNNPVSSTFSDSDGRVEEEQEDTLVYGLQPRAH